MPTKSKQKEESPVITSVNTPVRVCHVYTPAQGFSGFRNRVRFSNGEAVFREPVPEDFNDDGSWLKEKEAFDQLVTTFRAMPGYEVRMKAEVDLTDEPDKPADPED